MPAPHQQTELKSSTEDNMIQGSMARPRNLMDRTITELTMPLLRTVDLGGLGDSIDDNDFQMLVEDRYNIEYINVDC